MQDSIKIDFYIRLRKQYSNKERIESIINIVRAIDSESIKEIYTEALKEEEGNTKKEILYDKDAMNLFERMNWIPDSYISPNFESVWSENCLLIGDNGDGVLIVGQLHS